MLELRFVVSIPVVTCFSCTSLVDREETITSEDVQAIDELARTLPMSLSNEGWKAYESKFSSNYTNWSMLLDTIRTRDEYLSIVKQWYDERNRATDTEMCTLELIPIDANTVLHLKALKEEFNDPANSTATRERDLRFVSIYTREDGEWKTHFTAFMDKPQNED